MSGMELCYVAVVLAAIALVVYGLMEILKKRQPKETSESETISRQIRGFGMLILAQMVLLIGASVCFGLAGGAEKLLQKVSKMF